MSAPPHLVYGARKWRWLCAHMATAHRSIPAHEKPKQLVRHGRVALKHGTLKRLK